MNAQVENLELHLLLLFLALAGLSGLLSGAVLVMRPAWFARLGGIVNRWVSVRQLEAPLERSVSLDKWFYRHHRPVGLLMLAGACWLVAFLVSSFDKYRIAAILGRISDWPGELLESLLDGAVLLGLAGAVFAAMVSLFLWLRPSMLREFEHDANHWISTRRALQALEATHEELELWALRNFRLFGLLLLLGGLFILVMVAVFDMADVVL